MTRACPGDRIDVHEREGALVLEEAGWKSPDDPAEYRADPAWRSLTGARSGP
jgi:hypothetical protein